MMSKVPLTVVRGAEHQFRDEQFLLRIFDSFADPLVIYDRNFRILQINPALSTYFQRPPQQFIGQLCYTAFYQKDAPCDGCYVKEVFLRGQPQRAEKLVTLPDGSRRFLEVHAYPVKDFQGRVVQAIEHGRDISERKALEVRLRTSEERYRTMVELAREGIFIVDANARFTFVNRCLTEMLGYPPEKMLNQSAFDFMDERTRLLAQAQFERRRHGLADTYEVNFIKNDGSLLRGLLSAAPLMVNGAFLGAVGIVTDITHLKQVESQLRAAKEFREKIINGITDNLLVIDPRTYRIVQTNDSFLNRVGLAAPQVLDKSCYQIMRRQSHPCEVDGTLCPVQMAAREKQAALVDRVYPDAQGQDHILQIATYPLLNEQGEAELVIRLERDVTDKRKMADALTFRSRELQKAQHQLETLFELSRQVSAKSSLRELFHSVYEISLGVFPSADPLLLILEADGHGFMRLEDCHPKLAEVHQRLEQARVEQPGLVAGIIDYLRALTQAQILTFAERHALPGFFQKISEIYPAWFGLPILVQEKCLGIFLLGSLTSREFSNADLHFFQALFAQIGGHIRHLALHEAEVNHLRRQVSEKVSHGEIIGQSKKMREVFELIDLVSGSDATVLITGENGTGKEMVAQAIHRQSHRRRAPFVVANCSAYPSTLLESELFGHERGAFTGAIRQRKGRIERAQGGTLFLDEIGDISPATQVLLLRFLQDHCFERVGGEKTIKVDVRVLAATNRDLQRHVEGGRFRDDLYYRLNVIAIHLPTLKERKEDIPLLAHHFLKKYNLKEGKKVQEFSSAAMQVLLDHEWPGNVRQLENAVSHAVILTQGDVIRRRHLPRFLKEASEEVSSNSLAENERRLILRVLQEANWNKHDAAKRLNLSRSTLYSKIRRFGLEKIN